MKTEELANCLGISLSRLSEDIKALRKNGITILNEKGYRVLVEDGQEEPSQPYENLNRKTIRIFLLQQILCQNAGRNGMTREELAKIFQFRYGGEGDGWAEKKKKVSNTLSRDINEAAFKKKKNGRSDCLYPDERLPMPRRMTEWDAEEFCCYFEKYGESSPVEKGLEEIYGLLRYFQDGSEDSSEENDDAVAYQVHGKKNPRDQRALDNLQKIAAEPYKHMALQISYKTNAGVEKDVVIAVAYIVYSVDKNRWYLIGENVSGVCIIPIDAIGMIQRTDIENTVYHSEKYRMMLEETLSISIKKKKKTVTRFENLPFLKEKLETIHRKRKKSKLRFSEDRAEIIYEDVIRGKGDFCSFLRQYGSSVIAEEPKAIRDTMIESAKKILESYEELPGDMSREF